MYEYRISWIILICEDGEIIDISILIKLIIRDKGNSLQKGKMNE